MHASLMSALRGRNQHAKVGFFLIFADVLLNNYKVKNNDIKMLNRTRTHSSRESVRFFY